MSLIYLFSLLACNESEKTHDSSLEENENNTDTSENSTDTNEQNTEEPSYMVTTTISGSGVIEPAFYQEVPHGETLQFVLSASEGFEVSAVAGSCGGTLEASTYTTVPITTNCFVEAQFAEVEEEPVPYCENIPADLIDVVVCDPSVHLDDWSQGAVYSTNDIMIPQNKILAMPFTSNAIGLEGYITITNNMPGLHASGFYWRGWVSMLPGGEEIESCNPNGECNRCSTYSPNPNPWSFSWNQIEPGGWDCHIGTTVQTMYFNMEVRCYEFLSSNCTPGDFYNGNYFVGLFNIISD